MLSSAPAAVKERPVETQEMVELFCEQPLSAYLTSLSYNIFLILLCAIHGVQTRKLPENFNESRYIFISVLTTTFIWAVFLPTYFSAFYHYHQSALLAFCLILNGFITWLCLFLPKIYAIYFVDLDNLQFFASVATEPFNVSTKVSIKNIQVGPA